MWQLAFCKNWKLIALPGIYALNESIWRYFKHQINAAGLLHTCPFIAAGWTLVLLYVLSSCWSNLHTFSMIPLFTNVTTNPEFISCITAPTTATEGISMFFLFILKGIILFLWGKRHRLWWFDLVLLRCTLLQASPKLHNSQYTHAHTKIYMYVFINDKS